MCKKAKEYDESVISSMNKDKFISKCEWQFRRSQFWWVISILSILLIVCISIIITGLTSINIKDQLISVLGMISTMLAITLSIFSILFSYRSSENTQNVLNNINIEVSRLSGRFDELSDKSNKDYKSKDFKSDYSSNGSAQENK